MAEKHKKKLQIKEKKADGARGKDKLKDTEPGPAEDPSKRTTKMENTDLLGTAKEEDGVTADLLKDKQVKEKKAGRLPADGKETTGKMKKSEGTALSLDEHNEDFALKAVPEENTYQLGPTKRFPVSDATAILREALSSFLKEERYEVQRARELSLTLSAVIRERVKALRTPRYKLVVLVTVGQLNGQGLEIGSRCLWDVTHDTFASYSFKNSSLFGVASVFAVYFE
ncbi:tctex1 domain-containing protein 1-B-like isoform X2 [Kryptolebias marmoratus]|uniref:tctex1 domain-containing protein 1-B-like isoform X2 n=1 Tax=Kryptolebias marmoratus TaxID=37003 RepID=UPI0018AC9528|nr:tctex1 domain-containing protein 1-B-like isoform X2 [Kryptolebias marmoratus]